jgi:integrase
MAKNPEGLPYCTPYILRHNFATRKITGWMKEGKDFSQCMPYLSAYMGHETFHETCYYFHLMPDQISRMDCMDISGIIAEVFHEN